MGGYQPVIDRGQTGAVLAEVMVSAALLAVALIPLLELFSTRGMTGALHREMATQVAQAKLEQLGQAVYLQGAGAPWPAPGVEEREVGERRCQVAWAVEQVQDSWQPESQLLRRAVVTVSCLDGSRPMTPVRMVTYLEKVHP